MIKTFNYIKTLLEIEDEILSSIKRVLHSEKLILGPETEAFEKEFADFTGAKYCIGVNSGTTALQISLMAAGVGPGDEVITVSNTCVPTISAIELNGAVPIFIDVNDIDLMMNPDLIENAITSQTKCILPVHLWGQSADIEKIKNIANRNGIFLIEDCAQATGTQFNKRHVGNFGLAGCFSFYPTKNLGAFGDAGAVITNDDDFAMRLRLLREYGYDENRISIKKGMNARISEIQAAILRVKLKYLETWISKRRQTASLYDENIKNSNIKLPYSYPERKHSYHQYVIRCKYRDEIIQQLKEDHISYGIHYPIPIQKMPAYRHFDRYPNRFAVTEKACQEILSLPIHENLTNEEIFQVIFSINKTSIF